MKQTSLIITFNSTTDVFKAEKYIEENKQEYPIEKKEIINIPYGLSKSCYGLGISLICNENNLHSIVDNIKNKIDYKLIWIKDINGNFSVYQGDVFN